MNGLAIIGLIMGAWALYKFVYAKKVVGKVVQIKAFRKKSGLLFFGDLELKVEEMIRAEGGNWLYIPLLNEVEIKERKYNYLIVASKKPDDNINKKKAVVCHVKAGNSEEGNGKTVFIDWGLVKIV
jgi:hypothetical protein